MRLDDMSMEFLMGRALGNNLINLTEYDEVKEALEELGFDLNVIEDQEPDAALGNGGLGRLAACFLDSLATLNYAAGTHRIFHRNTFRSDGGRALNFLGGVKVYRRISNSECHQDACRESDCTR